MKNIVFLIASISGSGGTERVCCEIANSLSNLGYPVTILSMYGNRSFFSLSPSIAVKEISSAKPKTLLMIPVSVYKIRSILKQIRPDILISVDAALFSYAYVAAFSRRIAHIVWEHFNFNVSLGTGVRVISRRLAARYSTAVVTLTDKDVTNWKVNLNCRCMILSIPNPSPFPRITPDETARKPIVLSIGRLTSQKGFDRLLEGWAKITGRTEKIWELHIIGSGELKGYLEEIIDLLNLNSVKMINATKDIQHHYKEASIYCMTSRFEGFPMVLIEAQSFGLPVICYDCPTGPAEIINPQNGILVPDGDEDVLLQSLLHLMENKSKRLAMGKHAFENSSKFHIDAITGQWIALLNRI
jgi:glycosyltransferase involved in cell wall biosynthesis